MIISLSLGLSLATLSDKWNNRYFHHIRQGKVLEKWAQENQGAYRFKVRVEGYTLSNTLRKQEKTVSHGFWQELQLGQIYTFVE